MQPTPPPAAPAPPPVPGVRIQVPGAADIQLSGTETELAVPRTQAEVEALRARGNELSRQLTSAQGRRDEIAEELAGTSMAEGAIRAGLEQRLAQLDGRILRIEEDIAANGRLLAAAPPALLTNSSTAAGDAPYMLSAGQITGISIVGTIFVAMPLAVGLSRLMWKRANRPTVPAIPAETQARLHRMEQAVDVIALEVERMSESQRFLTRILTEPADARQALALPAGAPEPVAAADGARRFPVGE